MPGVQNKYSIDVINRFAIEDDDVEDEDAENIDPFEELKALNQKAEDAKNAPKPKVVKKKAQPAAKPAQTPAGADGEKKVERRSDRGGRGGGRGRGRDDRRPRQPRQGGGDAGGGVEAGQTEGAIDRPKRFDAERRRRSPRGGGRGGGRGGERRQFDRKSRDPKSSQKPFEKKEGSGAGNWGTTEDELQGQTEKVEGETEGEKTEEAKEEVENQKEEVPPPEPEEKTMTLEEYYASRKKSNRNPNAKTTEEKTPEAAKSFEKARQGRKARMAPVDFRPAPLVQRGGDRRPRRDNRGDRNKQEKKTSGYDLASDFPSL